MITLEKPRPLPTRHECNRHLAGVQDALYVLNGKWKLPIIIALTEGHKRFKDLQRTIGGITPKLLTKELRELEINGFLERKVYPSTPVLIEYELTDYSDTLQPVITALSEWGIQHRARILSK